MSGSPELAGVSAMVAAYARIEQTLHTLEVLESCDPPPAEIIVHVDGGQQACADAVRNRFKNVRIIVSEGRVGPGGGRNRMMEAARTELVASFDDDSWPVDRDFFARVQRLADALDAAVYTGGVVHRGEPLIDDAPTGQWCADFCGGAAVFRRSLFLRAGGYVPVATAYGIEEVDLAIRLSAMGGLVFQTPWLRVFHDTDLARHADREVTAASIANIGLLTYLRYPPTLWWVGAVQLLRRVVWLLKVGRLDGIHEGVGRIPGQIRRFATYRRTVGVGDLRSYWIKRRRPGCIAIPPETLRGGQEAVA